MAQWHISNNELLASGYNIVRRDCLSDKRGGVLIALRESIQSTRLAWMIILT